MCSSSKTYLNNPQAQLDYILRGSSYDLLPDQSALLDKLTKQRPLKVKFGIDPTAPDLHLGHTVCLHILRRFQDLGHEVILLLGGFTAQLGDPSGRNQQRIPLAPEQVKENSTSYLAQAGKILDLSKLTLKNNLDWLAQMPLTDILKLLSSVTVNQMIAKEGFGSRLEEGNPLYLHETIYPVLQGYDSVMLKADIEIGGQDQRFNLLTGRTLQKQAAQSQQVILMTPLLIGLDGKRKMSKSFNNHIAIEEDPTQIYGKVMSLPDEMLLEWYELISGYSVDHIKQVKEKLLQGANPRDLKMPLAKQLVAMYHSSEQAEIAQQDFIKKFQKREIPTDMPVYIANEPNISLAHILAQAGITSSASEAKRKIKEKAVKINGQNALIECLSQDLSDGDILQLGKRKFLKIVKD